MHATLSTRRHKFSTRMHTTAIPTHWQGQRPYCQLLQRHSLNAPSTSSIIALSQPASPSAASTEGQATRKLTADLAALCHGHYKRWTADDFQSCQHTTAAVTAAMMMLTYAGDAKLPVCATKLSAMRGAVLPRATMGTTCTTVKAELRICSHNRARSEPAAESSVRTSSVI